MNESDSSEPTRSVRLRGKRRDLHPFTQESIDSICPKPETSQTACDRGRCYVGLNANNFRVSGYQAILLSHTGFGHHRGGGLPINSTLDEIRFESSVAHCFSGALDIQRRVETIVDVPVGFASRNGFRDFFVRVAAHEKFFPQLGFGEAALREKRKRRHTSTTLRRRPRQAHQPAGSRHSPTYLP